ncbi:SDR family oxidoreductase [Candidatus Dojkabacteria bacterium]|uniref:SDR family oxidoreductase n=1 Tax=Candidatus Dojkabacteria bacterium TaxID=2099670 RepID=A0A955RLC4_9BACT|nr:SDR family oxidoreductase [Candidatus Dojkabacteria bacterium]
MNKKTILITGSSRGIGKAIAKLAVNSGYRVILHGKTDSPELKETEKELSIKDKLVFDISDKNECIPQIESWIENNGRIDVLVNNAGIAKNFLKDIQYVDNNKAIEEFNTNVIGTLNCIQAVLPSMKENQEGNIINIASIKGYPELSTLSTLTYATTKAGVISLTKSIAKAYANQGIRCNSISPGYIETDQVKDWNSETFDRIKNGTLAGRIGKPEEVANMVMFLASEQSSYINGEDILIDGGYRLKGK